MKFKRLALPIIVVVSLLFQFIPVTDLGVRPVAAIASCDAAEFVADVTVPDGSSFAPGASFAKTWRFRNSGTCTWSTSYGIAFVSGTQMGAPAVVNMPASVAPGATVDVTVSMAAPSVPGHYRGYWLLRNASGTTFGTGATGTTKFFVDINVTTSYSTAYDFVASYCSATWSSGAGTLPCPGTDGNASGYVIKQDTPTLENGSIDTSPALVVGPQNVTDGIIQGTYPAFTVQAGDRFQSIVSCGATSTSCYVTYRLDYRIGSGSVHTFWSFREKYEGFFYRANLDLSSLAGQSVSFILVVSASGSPTGDRALWGGAKIVRATGGPVSTSYPLPTVLPSACDRATFIADVTIPDGTVLSGGTPFTKTWRLRNAGSCTWTTAYKIVFISGDAMGAATAYNLPSSVAPGALVDLSVNMTAPSTSGNYRGYWRLQNGSGVNFGVGTAGTGAFFVEINVTSTYGTVYDFYTNACTATWSSGAGVLPCPGTDGDARGFVLKLASPIMENNTAGQPGLLTFPQNVTDGYIQGVFPAFSVLSGDRFQASVYCQYGAVDCYATFRLDYQIGAGAIQNLKIARERYEGLYYRMDVDLSALAGQSVKFILTLQASGSPTGDRAVWSAPRLVRSIAGPTPTGGPTVPSGPTPTRTPTPTGVIVGPSADMAITINDSLSTYTPGGTATYTVVVNNTGPSSVIGADVTIIKPLHITSWTVTCVPEVGATCTAGPTTPPGNISDLVNIPAGKWVTYSVVSSISASAVGNLVTTATVTNPGATPDPNLANNSATDTDSGPSADLSITNTDGHTVWTPGGSTTYTIVVTNNGPLNVTGAVFTDNKPAQVTSWSWTCAPDSGATCGAGSGGPVATNISDTVNIPAGKKVTYTIVASLSGAIPGSLVNTATITAPVSTPDPVPANNTATDTDSGPSADLAVTKSDGVTFYTQGGTLTYTIRVVNNGPQTVVGATFADNIPTQINSWSWTCVPDFSATCTAGPVISGANYTDSINVPAGQGVTYTVVATVDGAATGSLVNTASVTTPGAIPDPILANNTATDTDAAPTADLAVTMTDGVSIYPPGGTVIYTIVVTNNGPSSVTGATITDLHPAQITSWIWTCVADSGAVCTPGPVSPVDFGDVVDIPAGKKITYTVVASVDLAAAGSMTNTLDVTAPAAVPDPIPGNSSASDTDAQPSADLAVIITDMVVTYVPGGSVTYTITVTNSGPSNVVGATFSDALPVQGLSWNWSCAPDLGAVCTPGPVAVAGDYTDTVSIPVGKRLIYTAVMLINGAAVGPMVNTATITAPVAPFPVPDPFLVNNAATDIDTP